jgi:hypothetical protein
VSQELFDRLAEPFPADAISWRVGSTTGDKSKGMALAYLDARDVMDRLDRVCGPAGWQCDYPHANGKTVCRIGIKVGEPSGSGRPMAPATPTLRPKRARSPTPSSAPPSGGALAAISTACPRLGCRSSRWGARSRSSRPSTPSFASC